MADALHEAASAVGLSRLPDHAATLLLSFLFFSSIHKLVSPLLTQIVCPTVYGSFNNRQKNSWDVHVVSLVHALIIVPLCASILHSPSLAVDPAFGWDPRFGRAAAIACGYFLWDTLDSIVNFVDLGFVIHGFSCFVIFLLCMRPFLGFYAVRFLLWEVSTPFLNINWFLDKLGYTGSHLQLINGICLLSSFLLSRLVYGGFMSFKFFQTLYAVRNDIPFVFVLVYGIGNLVLQALNWIWFRKMIALLKKRMSAGRSTQNGVNGNVKPRP